MSPGKVLFVGGLLAAALPNVARAAVVSASPASHPADLGTALALLVAAPFIALLLACYVKIAVVLSVLRAALGGALPPRSVNAAVAVLLTAFVMAPVAEKAWTAAAPALARPDASNVASNVADAASAAAGPARDFLLHHADPREQKTFLDLARRLRPPAERDAVTERDLSVLAPAFIVGELKAAFQIGFLLLLPFLVLDLVISSLLTTLGMYSLDPRAVALPFKLLLFVLADGWHLVARGLLLSYA